MIPEEIRKQAVKNLLLFTEFEINIRGHFFSDGCGKSSIAATA